MEKKIVMIEDKEYYLEIENGKEFYTSVIPESIYDEEGGRYEIGILGGVELMFPEGMTPQDLEAWNNSEEHKEFAKEMDRIFGIQRDLEKELEELLEDDRLNNWGRMKVSYLENENPDLLHELLEERELISYLVEFQENVQKFIEQETLKMMQSWGLTEELKRDNPEEYNGLMKNLEASIREIIMYELVQN